MPDVAAVCLVVTALLAYLNHRFIGLPTALGVMAAALVLSLLLFAGALHVDLSELSACRWQIGGLAVVGTSVSTLVVGGAIWWLLPLLGLPLALPWCLLFGALISPTDPIAVMGILKSANAPKNLELVIAGESLFNDGVGVVISIGTIAAAALAVVVTLAARGLTVGLPIGLARRAFKLPVGAGRVLTWGGPRGGISVALALSLPAGPERETVLALTYGVVVFSILVQGLTIGKLVRRVVPG